MEGSSIHSASRERPKVMRGPARMLTRRFRCSIRRMPSTHPARSLVLVALSGLLAAPLFLRAEPAAPAAASSAVAGQAAGPRPITLEDYPKFKRIAGTSISNDGKWMLYTVTPNEG